MRFRQTIAFLLVFAITCGALPPDSPHAQAANPSVQSTAAPPTVESDLAKHALRSNMRVAAPPLLADFPGACTPRDRVGINPPLSQQVRLPFIPNKSANAAAATAVDPAHSTLTRPTIPLDPSLIATPLDGDTSFAESIVFLYSGDNPVQTGVAPGAIDPAQASVLRGKVLAPNGEALAGVKIQIFGHTEYGQTLSRNDGIFDMVVNAAPVTLCFDLPGYLPTQRNANALWNDFTTLDDVILLRLDNTLSTIDLANSSAIQVAQGSVSSDGAGVRQATLLFAPNTAAEMVMADGSTQALSTLSVRATEFTVGENGPQAMPGDLPLASGYTYAVEFTVDEALRAGAVDLRFTKPVINYVENFLGFPAGMAVPTGYYDRGRGAWIPSDNGRVIQILSIQGGIALLDVNGSGQAGSTEQLAALGIDQSEQRTLAELYSAGQSLWRVPIPHFTPWDHNWPFGPPNDATAPNSPFPRPDTLQPNPCQKNGSIIECENQALGESINIAGTPFSLNYRSSRVPAREGGSRVVIPLSGSTLPASLEGIIVETEIAGQRESHEFGPEPDQLYEYRWDGTDVFGRPAPTGRVLTVRLGFIYPAIYRAPDEEFERSFAGFGGAQISANHVRNQITIWRTWETFLQGKTWDAATQALGGWTLNQQHAYDGRANVLHRGDGAEVAAGFDGRVLHTVAGVYSSSNVRPVDGLLATEVRLSAPTDIAAGPDGSIYFSSAPLCVYKIDPQGRIYRMTRGVGNLCALSMDGVPGKDLINAQGISLAPDGDLYVVNFGDNGLGAQVLRFRADGTILAVAGNGQVGFAGDGGPATEATMNKPIDVAVAPDGSFYIADFGNQRVRRVGTDGIITTVAGGGEPADGVGDGGPATAARLGFVRYLAVDQNGVLYIGHDNFGGYGNRVRRVGMDGIITTVAGGGSKYNEENELGVDSVLIGLYSLAIGPDNNLYLSEGNRIRMLGQDGRMTTVAGTTEYGYSEDGTPVNEAKLFGPVVGFKANGAMLVAETGNGLIRIINPKLNTIGDDEVFVPSSQGEEIYVFDLDGRHLRTVDGLTGSTLYSFGYDAQKRLITITDASANVTRVERNGDGAPTAIAGPFGQRTLLSVNEDGYLTSVTDPANAVHRMTYQQNGLLATFTTPNGDTNQFTYDDGGRLLRESFATGGGWTLAQISAPSGLSITVSSALSRTTTLAEVANSATSAYHFITFPDGTRTEMTATMSTLSSGYQTRYANGAVVESRFQPDGEEGFNSVFAQSTVHLPSGLQTLIRFERKRDFAIEEDPLSGLAAMTTTTFVNNQPITSIYDGGAKTTTNTSAAGRQSSLRYDELGRVVEQGEAGLAPIFYNYNERGLMTSMEIGLGNTARTYTLEYDNQGEAKAFINPLGERNALTVDAVGQVTSHTRPDGAMTTFAYDRNGNLTAITPPGGAPHNFTYNATNQVTSYSAPAVGSGNTTTSYAYNLDGQLTTVARPDGSLITVRYDTAGRSSQVELARGAIHYDYDDTTGQLSRVTAPDGGVVSYQHDGSLLTESLWSGAVAGVVQRSYDNFRRLSGLSVGGQQLTYTYDGDGLVTQAGDLHIDYNENGLPTGSLLSNLSTAMTTNEFGEWISSSAVINNSAIYAVTYTRDSMGRITRKVETVAGSSVTFDYAYSEVGRLRQVKQDGAVIATYNYDANGNRLSGPDGATASYDEQDRLLSYGNATYAYNNAGDLTAKVEVSGTTTYTYDELGNLLAVGLPDGRAIGYVIDGNNRRIGKTVDGLLKQGFLYQDQLRIVAELDGSNHVVSRFVYADTGATPAYMTHEGVTYRLVSDQVGSVRLVVNATTGAILQRLDYDAFGRVRLDTNPGFQPFGFAGGLYDPDTGLVRFGKRDYDAQSGRWTTKDALGMAGGDTNLYLYVGGDPVNLTDNGGDFFFVIGFVAAILLLSLLALPLAMKIVKKWQDKYKQQPERARFPLPPAPPQPCDQAPPLQPIPQPQPEPEPEAEPQPDPLPEEAPPVLQPEPPAVQPPEYMWAEAGSPPPCPSPTIGPPMRGTLCK